MYLNILDFIAQNLSMRWRLQLNGGLTLEGRFDKNQFERLRQLKEQGELDRVIHFKFAVFRTSRHPCIVNIKEIVTMTHSKRKEVKKHG